MQYFRVFLIVARMGEKVNAAQRRHLLYPFKFVVFKLELVAHIDAEGQQGDGNFGNNAGVLHNGGRGDLRKVLKLRIQVKGHAVGRADEVTVLVRSVGRALITGGVCQVGRTGVVQVQSTLFIRDGRSGSLGTRGNVRGTKQVKVQAGAGNGDLGRCRRGGRSPPPWGRCLGRRPAGLRGG